jgi:hypothetical protein
MLLDVPTIPSGTSAERATRPVQVPRMMTFWCRSEVRARALRLDARRSASLQRVALDVPAGVDLDRVLQQ